MAEIANAARDVKTIADPCAEYETMKPLWIRARAICGGERFVKALDQRVDRFGQNNILVPFSTKMTDEQYRFYKSEAELPGIVAQFAKMLIGGLLRKLPSLELPKGVPEEAHDWIMNNFGQDGSSLVALMDSVLNEELPTGRAFVYVDYPSITPEQLAVMTNEEKLEYKPYPVLWSAESVINWRIGTDARGKRQLQQILVRSFEPMLVDENAVEVDEFHPKFVDTIRVHELDKDGFYQIRIFQEDTDSKNVPVVQGRKQTGNSSVRFTVKKIISDILFNGNRLKMIPAWPVNGSLDALESILMPLVYKEISLYNKVSRRNHLLFGAATFTPYVVGDMVDSNFKEIVNAGLGSWLKIPSGCTLDVLSTPTEALQDYDRAIAASIEEMARLGVRMLSPETDQSGIALEIRNASQTAQLGMLNSKVSSTFQQIIAFMINWRYDLDIKPSDVKFTLSSDFNPVPLGADWLRLATEWYSQGLIPRSIWLMILKTNDMLPPDYDDKEGRAEIETDMELFNKKTNDAYAASLAAESQFARQTSLEPKLKQVK